MLSERRCLLRDKDKWAPFCGVRRAGGVMHGIYFYIVFEVQVIKERVWVHGGPHSSLALNFNSWLLIGLWCFSLSLYLSSGRWSVSFEKWLVLLMESATLITNREIMRVSVLHRINYSVGVINVASPECKSAIYFIRASRSANKRYRKRNEAAIIKAFLFAIEWIYIFGDLVGWESLELCLCTLTVLFLVCLFVLLSYRKPRPEERGTND